MKRILTLILFLSFCLAKSELYSVVTMGEDSNLKKTNSLIFKEAKASSLVFVDERGIEFHIKIDKIVKIYDINNNEVNIQDFYFPQAQSSFKNNSNTNNRRGRVVYDGNDFVNLEGEIETPGDDIINSANMMLLGDLLPLAGLLVSVGTENPNIGIVLGLVGFGIKLYSYTQLKTAGKKMKRQSSRKL
mgnify:CR=1 FL=1